MKKIIVVIAAVLVCVGGYAQNNNVQDIKNNKSKEVISSMVGKFKSFENGYSVDFKASLGRDMQNAEGVLTVSGDKFKVVVAGNEIYFDGKTQYSFNRTSNEVTIEEPSQGKEGYIINPSQLFMLSEKEFLHSYRAEEKTNEGISADIVDLRPKANSSGVVERITAKINKTTSLPIEITVASKNSPTLTLVIKNITPLQTRTSDAEFVFDNIKHKNVEVIDFR